MSLAPPPFVGTNGRRNMRKVKLQMLRKTSHPCCNWCNCPLTEKTATVDHYVPLALGGLDNFNNYVLACQPCNAQRGHAMPDITDAAKQIIGAAVIEYGKKPVSEATE